MKETIRLFMILLTIVVILLVWITGQLGKPGMQVLILSMIAASILVIFVLNLIDSAEERKKRRRRESRHEGDERDGIPDGGSGNLHRKVSDTDFSLTEKKRGLTWGGGNIKASEAIRGTRRKFLGR
jgi:hypothetical protein